MFVRAARPAMLLSCLLALAACADSDRGSPPIAASLLVITLDTARADHLSCYGYPRATTPHLDALAAAGHRFDAAYVPMPTTLPSHASMFTSLHPGRLGVRSNLHPVPDQAATLAERLRAQGFSTGAFVSSAVLHPRFGLDQGFDTYEFPDGAQTRAETTRERASAWLRARGGERFFGFVHLIDPHTWYDAPDPSRERTGGSPRRTPPERGFLRRPEQFSEAVRREAIDAYDAELRYADREIGLLLEDLARFGLAERTIVAFLSDHGETLDELLSRRYAFDHGEFLYQRELRVPFLLRLPGAFGFSAPQVHPEVVSTLDLLPTLLELLGVPFAGPGDGRSLVPLLAGEDLDEPPVVSVRQDYPGSENPAESRSYSVVHGRWHWLRLPRGEDRLFDLETDPLERRNVIARHPVVAERMAETLRRWREVRGEPIFGDVSDEVDEQLLRHLEALGYTDDGS